MRLSGRSSTPLRGAFSALSASSSAQAPAAAGLRPWGCAWSVSARPWRGSRTSRSSSFRAGAAARQRIHRSAFSHGRDAGQGRGAAGRPRGGRFAFGRVHADRRALWHRQEHSRRRGLPALSSLSRRGLVPPAVRARGRHPPGPTGEVEWEKAPGVPSGLGLRLEALFKEGRLLLILDGLDENLKLLDMSIPAAWSFWGMASRNRCILTCRDRFYSARFAFSPAERIFGGGLKIMSLPPWGGGRGESSFSAVSPSAGKARRRLARSSRASAI